MVMLTGDNVEGQIFLMIICCEKKPAVALIELYSPVIKLL